MLTADAFGLPVIPDFRGDYFFLSNFYQRQIEYKGIAFHSTEQAYMWEKTEDLDEQEAILRLDSPGKVKRFASDPANVTLKPNWDNIRISVMRAVLKAKFDQHLDLRDRLLATGDAYLVEGNWWHDNFWGDCIWASTGMGAPCEKCKNKPGENWLGKLLMELRDQYALALE